MALENACFSIDRLSARSFRNFLKQGKPQLIVDEQDGQLRGYSLILFHANTSLARLYSLGVRPNFRSQGVARQLMAESERRALAASATRMRLEVHQNNLAAQKLYKDLGYRAFAVYPDYYEDHAEAVRMEKHLAPQLSRDLNTVPYFSQSLDFTCGPACLIMAMARHDRTMVADRALEMRLWRETTTIFMTRGHGGCGALGLALAAWNRGFGVEVSLSDETTMFVDTVRDERKKEVIRLVEEGFQKDVAQTGIKVEAQPLGVADLCAAFDRGGVPIVLISSYRMTGDKSPHWVVVTAYDDRFIYINDPFVDVEENRSETDCVGIPLAPIELERMSRFGKRKHFATVIVYPLRQKGRQ
ncbi:peptidase C39 family protein [Magnetospira thiophila]